MPRLDRGIQYAMALVFSFVAAEYWIARSSRANDSERVCTSLRKRVSA
ncbi:hypothetical protein [Bradyrhizobium rifense]|nr:hypothetical protein [Bradyrhizobium rifense]